VIHEKANLNCDCVSLDGSSCHPEWNERLMPNSHGIEGSIQVRGSGLTRYGTMPLGTLRADGERVCASLPGSVVQPCFYLERTNVDSFRGSISGLSFAYCDFTRYQGRAHVVRDE
jgi:hypothetical protein